MLRLSSLFKQSLYLFSRDLIINENFYDLKCVSLSSSFGGDARHP